MNRKEMQSNPEYFEGQRREDRKSIVDAFQQGAGVVLKKFDREQRVHIVPMSRVDENSK